jgi:hypothetical protein
MRKEGIAVGAVEVRPDGGVVIYQQAGISTPAQPEQNRCLSNWLDVEV